MDVLLIGDIGWSGVYHLGDEAMTEAAIDLLQARGVDTITLVAGEPEAATAMYGLPAVARIGYRFGWSRDRMERRLAELTAALDGGSVLDGEAAAVVDAVAACDAVVIAGGGNINSKHAHHLFERVSLVRIARHLGRPVHVTSQTVGPVLRPADAELVREILAHATSFGAREATTHELAERLGGDPDRVVHGLDDAALLVPRDVDREVVAALEPPRRYAVASFAPYSSDLGMPRADFHRLAATTLVGLCDRHDAEVLLVPHLGSFDPERRTHDVATHDTIVAAADDPRLRSLPAMTARQVVALTEGALLSLSTRYHPTVLGPFAGTPSVAITTSHYSAVRMRGALANLGLGAYAMPVDAWVHGPFDEVVDDLLRRGPELSAHVAAATRLRREEQGAWWDAIVASIAGAPWQRPPDRAAVPDLEVPAPWGEQLRVQSRLSDDLGRARFQAKLHAQDLKAERARRERLEGRLSDARRELAALRGRRSVRVADRLRRERRPG